MQQIYENEPSKNRLGKQSCEYYVNIQINICLTEKRELITGTKSCLIIFTEACIGHRVKGEQRASTLFLCRLFLLRI